MELETKIRKLARSSYYLRIYNASKELNGLNLFDNKDNFSGIQCLFLYWLQVYSMLYKELGECEWLNLDEKVIDNDIRTEAFLYWRSKQIESDLKKYKADMRNLNKKNKRNTGRGKPLPVWQGKK